MALHGCIESMIHFCDPQQFVFLLDSNKLQTKNAVSTTAIETVLIWLIKVHNVLLS